ncbi:MAG: hypothetical protein N2383_10330 [Caldilineales bacterium]|nr:hypothetical protein [Caldilineales bacterium]
MTAATLPLDRETLLTQMTARLRELDDAGLLAVDRYLRELPPPTGGPIAAGPGLDRRQFLLRALGLGGGLVLVTAGGYAAVSYGVEAAKWRGLLLLYEQMERAGLDDAAALALVTVENALAALETGAESLRRGLERVEAGVQQLDAVNPTVREGIAAVEGLVEHIAQAVQRLEDALARFLEPAQPLLEAIKAFVNRLLELLPFGIGDEVRRVLVAIADVLSALPELILAVNTGLLTPLREVWFGDDPEQSLLGRLENALISGLFDPLQAHLTAVADFAAAWQTRVGRALETALDERSALRAEIERYR